MYDELVKRLRDAAKMSEALAVLLPHSEGNAMAKLYNEAADAIEKLLQKTQQLPRWIPVTERLPNGEAERYLAAASLMTALELWVSICYYADNLEEVDEYDFKGEKHGGFYGYDNECGYYEKNGVQYWMPLPEPPKEGDTWEFI